MTTSAQAFDAGLALNLVGVPFDASTVLQAVRTSAEGEVAERAASQTEALTAHAKQAGRHLKTVRGILGDAGLDAPESPQSQQAYDAYVDHVSGALYATLDDAGQRAYLAGWWLGAWTRAANLVAIALYLQDAGPDDPYLTEVVQAYAGQLAEAAVGLAGAREGASEAVDAAIAAAHAQLVAVPSPTAGEPLGVAGAYQEALEALDSHVGAVRAALG